MTAQAPAQTPTIASLDVRISLLMSAARRSGRRLRNAARDHERDMARLQDALAEGGIDIELVQGETTTAREGEGGE